jgi:hypothetical protein
MIKMASGAIGAAIALSAIAAANGAIELRVPGRASATPSIAAAGDTVVVSWGATMPDGATDLFAAVSRDGGRSFAAPVRVNDVDGDACLNGEQPPRVTIAPDSVTIVWTTKGARGTKLLYARSADGGRTFATSAAVPGGDAAGNRGWENIATAGAGASTAHPPRTFVVWLDHRELARQDGEVAATHHDHAAAATKPDGVAMAQQSKLYVASLDGAPAPVGVTGGVCYCCKTALAAAADGSLFAAWRHVYPGNIRDIAFTLSRDGGRTFAAPVRVSEDKWQLEGCPDDGPAMAVDAGGRIHIAWPTLIKDAGTDTIALFYASSADGRRFTARERIPTDGMPHHPQIAIGADGAPVLAWDEAAAGNRRAVFARVAGQSPARFTRQVLGDTAVYPVVAATPRGAIVAWTSGKSPDSVIRIASLP